MIRTLEASEIEALLHEATVGRIGGRDALGPYIVPVTYAYEDGCIYGHSAVGRKVRMMRADPEVCFEVDVVEDLARWRSVVAMGTYEELHGEAAQHGMQVLMQRFLPLMTHEGATPTHGLGPHGGAMPTDPGQSVVFRLHLHERTGRAEG